MIAMSYKKGDVEILLTKVQDKPIYGAIRRIKGEEPVCETNKTYEDAKEIYDYLMDKELGADK